jgi:dolichol-phosphate mannosyltransferase
MSSSRNQVTSDGTARISLILPVARGQAISPQQIADYRRALTLEDSHDRDAVEVVIASPPASEGASDALNSDLRFAESQLSTVVTRVQLASDDWTSLARAGMQASCGEHLVVVDLRRSYPQDSLARVAARLHADDWDVAVGIPRFGDAGLFAWLQMRFGLGLISRLFLGTSDIFSGLFAVRRSLWDRHTPRPSAGYSSLILELLSRQRARCVDIRVPGGGGFKPRGVGFEDIRPLKHLLDLRFGNYSRLVQFCVVGASGMVIDLSCYAFFQWLFSFTRLYTLTSGVFGVSWHVAVARALSIAIALVWNFAFNRRLTFNDARKSGLAGQFLKYALTNALAIAFNFSVSLYLPGRVGFFARHKLAAAMVAIVAATGINFSMVRWLVFARRSEPSIKPSGPHERSRVQPSTVP